MKILFCGTPAFAVPSLRAVAAHSDFEITAVLCRPDKPSGRGMKLRAPAVKTAALELGLPVMQPRKMKKPREDVQALAPDVAVVVAYGVILRKWFLDLPVRGCINVHGSLLPALRGAAPIQRAILEGLPVTGITLMQMDEGMDTGPLLLTRETPVAARETAGTLHDKLAGLGAEVLVEGLEALRDGRLTPTPQDDSKATLAPKIESSLEVVDWFRPAEVIDRQVRALSPRPGASTWLAGRRLRLVEVLPFEGEAPAGVRSSPPGTLHGSPSTCRRLLVRCGEGVLELLRVQPEGKRPMDAQAFVNGYGPFEGTELATPSVPAV